MSSKRIMLVGCCGAGKSTLSRQLSTILNLELIHLDQLYWQPNWVETTLTEWPPIVRAAAAKEEWIIDGNYGGTMDIRIERATHIIFLDFPRWLCMWRVIKRIWKNHGKVRPDMPEGCQERFSLEFLLYVFHFKSTRSPGIHKKLDRIKEMKKVYVLTNDQDVDDFLKTSLIDF